jgi:PKD repeat protein
MGTAFSYQISATNTPTSYGATGLPAGLSVSSTKGLISGTPAATGTSTATLSATNSNGTGHATLTLTIAVAQPVITSATTASGKMGTAFSYQISATNTPTSYGATGLPAGLSVSSTTGLISGTPPATGTSTVTLSATNSNGTGHATLTLTIAVAQPVITSATTASGKMGTAFSYQISATNTPTSYGATGLPAGLSVSSTTGLISGTPAATGTSAVTLSATNSNGTGHATLTLTIGSAQSPSIALSSNRKYLINPTGQPVFLVAEQGFDLNQVLSAADLEVYLSDRSSKGFNLIWMSVVDNSYYANPQYDSQGNAPFSGGDFLNMQPAYFTHLDYVLNRMAAYGITALLGPAFSGYPCGPPPSGYCLNMEAASDATMTAYGEYLGDRYKNFSNIIWMIGGDMDSSGDLKTKHNDIAVGIRSKDTVHLMTAENIRGQSSLDIWSGYSWLDLNGLYNLPSDIPSAAEKNFTRSDFLPEFMMEDWCENEHSETPLSLRTEGYWAVLSGAYLGRDFCNYPIWAFAAGWKAQLNSPGSVSESLTGKLFRSREHWLMAPDINHSVVTAGYGTGATLTVTSRTSDGQSIIAYIPNGIAATITVDMTKIISSTSTVQGWWFDPQTGATLNLGAFSNSGKQNFRPPDSNDWVLVLDDASAKLPAPGTSTLIAH